MPSTRRPSGSPQPQRVLLVEGTNDYHTILNLCAAYDVPETFPVEKPTQEDGGVATLLNTFRGRLKAQNETHLGIVLDADADLQARWQSVTDRMQEFGYTSLPAQPDPNGTVLVDKGPMTIGVWIMPDNTLPGTLENFVRMLVPDDDTLWARVENCVAQIPASERLFPDSRLSKVHLHTWLAWQNEPGKPIGQAIMARYLQSTPQAQTFVAWLNRLFNAPA